MLKMDRDVLKKLVVLSLPTVLEQVLSTLLQYVDTMMVGRLGERATTAVSVTTTVTWLVNSVASAVGVAVIAMISRAAGSGDTARVKRISEQVLFAVLVFGVALTVPSLLLAPYIPVWMGAEQAVWGDASAYFAIISLPLIFRTAGSLFGAAMRAVQDTRTPMKINMLANAMNVILNWVFIYQMGIGVRGAAFASAISFTVSGVLMYLAYRRNRLLRWETGTFQVDRGILWEGLTLSLPVLGTSIVSCMGYIVFAGMVSHMGTAIFAAHSIAVTAETIFYIPGYGIRTATSALVGNSLGERSFGKFETVARYSVVLTVAMMMVSGFILYQIASPLMGVFTSSDQVAQIGANMLRIVAFSEPFFGLMIVLEGILYGLGRTKYSFFVECIGMWCVRIFLTYLCVGVWHLGLRQVWYCMIADNVCKAVLFVLPLITRKKRQHLFEI